MGHGIQDIPGVLKASVEAGAQWVVVEQDLPRPGKPPEGGRKEQGPDDIDVEAAARFANAAMGFNNTRPGATGEVADLETVTRFSASIYRQRG